MENIDIIKAVIVAALAAYEVLSRVIPTTKIWSIIGNVLNILKKISDVFENRKK